MAFYMWYWKVIKQNWLESNKAKLVCEREETEGNGFNRIYLAVVEGLVTSSKSESYVGGSIVTSRVSQPGHLNRVGIRRREVRRSRELRHKFL